jgi:hypothetical protein
MRGTLPYLDFDLLIRRTEGGYRAQVLSSPAGEATADFAAPFSELELENFVLRVGRRRRGTRRKDSPEMEAVRSVGKRLYEAVFSGGVRDCWASSLSRAEARNAGLRLRLRISDAPELNNLPWEYLYNAPQNYFLTLSESTPLIRYLDLPQRIRPLTIDAPLEILVMISSPSDHPSLDVEAEWSQLNEALAGLLGRGQARVKRLAEPRLSALQRELRGGRYHVLHFIGHGEFDPGTEDGALVLCDEVGKGQLVTGERLGTILRDHRSMRLVVLNACEGARSSPNDPFAGVAQTLVQQGTPAVIAMQFEITDQAAITFSEEFYAATADGYPVDAALSAARKAIYAAENDIEWGTPVLFLRAPNGQLFSINREAVHQPEEQGRRVGTVREAEEEQRRAEAAAQAAEEQRQAEAAAQAAEEQRQAEAAAQRTRRPEWAKWKKIATTIAAIFIAIGLLATVAYSYYAELQKQHAQAAQQPGLQKQQSSYPMMVVPPVRLPPSSDIGKIGALRRPDLNRGTRDEKLWSDVKKALEEPNPPRSRVINGREYKIGENFPVTKWEWVTVLNIEPLGRDIFATSFGEICGIGPDHTGDLKNPSAELVGFLDGSNGPSLLLRYHIDGPTNGSPCPSGVLFARIP